MNSITKNINVNKTKNVDNNNAERQGTNVMNPTYDHLNKWQKLHLEGKFNVYEPIPQDNGEPLPPLAVQWKEDAKRRWGVKNENTGNR